MNILIDIGHPAHVHMFRCFAHEMIARGHHVLFTTRDKEFEIQLLQKEGLDFVNLGKKHTSIIGKCFDLFRFGWKVLRSAYWFKADIFLSHGSITASHVAWLMRKPNIAFEDTYNMEQVRLYKPFTNVILTSNYPNPLTNYKANISYAGYHELLYLHPNRFTPKVSILHELGVQPDDKYVVVRFVAWEASHDAGHVGLTIENKIDAIHQLAQHARVFISSEKSLPAELEQYRAPWKPEQIHDVLAHASLVFGESATMVSEGVVLGVPGVYIDNDGRYYTRDMAEKYDLCYNYTESEDDQKAAIACAVDIIKKDKVELQAYYAAQRDKLLNDCIDVTAFLVWFVENYPEGKCIMKENPDYQYKFK